MLTVPDPYSSRSGYAILFTIRKPGFLKASHVSLTQNYVCKLQPIYIYIYIYINIIHKSSTIQKKKQWKQELFSTKMKEDEMTSKTKMYGSTSIS